MNKDDTIGWAVLVGLWSTFACGLAVWIACFGLGPGSAVAGVVLALLGVPLAAWYVRQLPPKPVQPLDHDDPRAVAQRAEIEHALYLSGDSRGVYGQFTPADLSKGKPR